MSDLWILGGQSNMEGCGLLATPHESPDENVRCFVHGDRWEIAKDPLHWMIEANDSFHWNGLVGAELEAARVENRRVRTKGVGLGLSFAKEVAAKTGHKVDLLPVAHGGTSMQQWSPSLKHLGGASLYGAMLRRTKLALETSPESQLKGVLWYQGESDCNESDAAVYTERMKTLISSWRTDLGEPNLPFYLVQLGVFSIPDSRSWDSDPVAWKKQRAAWTSIREQQRLLATEIPGVQVVPAIDLDLDDGIHIGTPGLKILGKRMANVALRGGYGQDAPSAISLKSIAVFGDINVAVHFEGVNGRLQSPDPLGRISGFGMVVDEIFEPNWFHKARVDPNDGARVLLYTNEKLLEGAQLAYGFGFNPFCQLVDQAGMAAPVFGPITV